MVSNMTRLRDLVLPQRRQEGTHLVAHSHVRPVEDRDQRELVLRRSPIRQLQEHLQIERQRPPSLAELPTHQVRQFGDGDLQNPGSR
jgi:hypothetical protein